MIIDDFVNNELFIDDNSLINVSLVNNNNTISKDNGNLENSNNYSL
jgi:hypothetical protein